MDWRVSARGPARPSRRPPPGAPAWPPFPTSPLDRGRSRGAGYLAAIAIAGAGGAPPRSSFLPPSGGREGAPRRREPLSPGDRMFDAAPSRLAAGRYPPSTVPGRSHLEIPGGLAAAGGGDVPDDSPARRSYPSKSFPRGSPAHGPGRPRRRGNPNPAKPLADRALPATENCPSDHGPLYAPRAGPHRSQRQGKGRDMNRRSPRADRRIGAPRGRKGFGRPRVFNGLRPLAADRGAVFGVFSARFGPFLSGIVRPSPG